MRYTEPKFTVGPTTREARERYAEGFDAIDWCPIPSAKPEAVSAVPDSQLQLNGYARNAERAAALLIKEVARSAALIDVLREIGASTDCPWTERRVANALATIDRVLP